MPQVVVQTPKLEQSVKEDIGDSNFDDFLAMMADEAGMNFKTDEEILNPARKDKPKSKTVQ